MEDNAGFQNRALRAARQVHPVRRKQTVSAVRSLLRVASNVDELRDLLENGSPYSEQKILVCWLVGRLGLSELSQCMAFLVTTDDEPIGVRLAAIEALGFLELDEALHTLLAATIDPAVEVRRGAARSLQWWGLADTAKRRLLEIASDRNEVPGVRAQAAESLASFRGAEVGSALRVLLLDESPEVRYCGAWALGQIRDTAAINALMKLTEDASETTWGPVREAAEQAVDEIRQAMK